MIIHVRGGFKYQKGQFKTCQKMKKGFVRMNLVNAIAMKDQILEEETRKGNIARKTVRIAKYGFNEKIFWFLLDR